MLLSSDQGGTEIAHVSGVYRFPFAGQPAEVPDDLGVHLLAVGGFSSPGNQLEGRHAVWLQKEQGGCEITHRGTVYQWPEDGAVTEVPDELAMELVPLGGYKVVPPPGPEGQPERHGGGAAGDGPGESPEDDGREPGGQADAKPAARKGRGRTATGTDQA